MLTNRATTGSSDSYNPASGLMYGLVLLTDEQLMAACQLGNSQAFDELFHRYGSFIRNFVQRKISDPGHAEDVVQEIFLRLYRSSSRFDATRQLRKWLFAIAANEVRRYWSRPGHQFFSLSQNSKGDESSPDYQELIPDTREGPDELYLQSSTSVNLRNAIQELPEFQRTALLLRTYRNLTLKEIAQQTGSSVATVNSRLHHATAKVRKCMRDTGCLLPAV